MRADRQVVLTDRNGAELDGTDSKPATVGVTTVAPSSAIRGGR